MRLEYSKRRLVTLRAVTAGGADLASTQGSIRRIAPRNRLWILGLALKDSGAPCCDGSRGLKSRMTNANEELCCAPPRLVPPVRRRLAFGNSSPAVRPR